MIAVQKIMDALSERRSIFHSEADLQHEFAWIIREQNPAAAIRLEVPLSTERGTVHADVAVRAGGVRYVFELKYKTREIYVNVADEEFRLRSHIALPLGRYDVLKDLERIESVVSADKADRGAVVFLSNDSAYWYDAGSPTQTSYSFRLTDGREIQGELDWASGTGDGTKKSRENPIQLRGTYRVSWKNFSSVPTKNYSEFRYLAFEVLGENIR